MGRPVVVIDTLAAVEVTVTVELACCVESAALTAVTATAPAGAGGVAGAVYKPLEEIVPTVAFPPAIPFTFQVTAVLEVPLTVAVNCFEVETATDALVGDIDTETGARMLTEELLITVGSAELVAVTVTLPPLGIAAGAV